MIMIFKSDAGGLTGIAAEIAGIIGKHRYILLEGELGSGKTTLTAEILKLSGVEDQVYSPTFSIINTYRGDKGDILHIDLYRLGSVDELEMTGFFELVEESSIAFIEWADKFNLEEMLPDYCKISIKIADNGFREYTIEEKPTAQ